MAHACACKNYALKADYYSIVLSVKVNSVSFNTVNRLRKSLVRSSPSVDLLFSTQKIDQESIRELIKNWIDKQN